MDAEDRLVGVGELIDAGRPRDALRLLEHLGATSSSSESGIDLQELGLRAEAHDQLGEFGTASGVFDRLVEAIRDEAAPMRKASGITAAFNRVVGLAQSGDDDTALEAVERLLRAIGEPPDEALAVVADAGGLAANLLSRKGHLDQALAAYDAVTSPEFSESPDPAVQVAVARARQNKAATLAMAGKIDDAISTFDDVDRLLAANPDPEMREIRARALCGKAGWLYQSGRNEMALEGYRRVLADFGSDDGDGLRIHLENARRGIALLTGRAPEQ